MEPVVAEGEERIARLDPGDAVGRSGRQQQESGGEAPSGGGLLPAAPHFHRGADHGRREKGDGSEFGRQRGAAEDRGEV